MRENLRPASYALLEIRRIQCNRFWKSKVVRLCRCLKSSVCRVYVWSCNVRRTQNHYKVGTANLLPPSQDLREIRRASLRCTGVDACHEIATVAFGEYLKQFLQSS